nr:hypothetical protein [Candidatus Sigynarchaeota archaeon]
MAKIKIPEMLAPECKQCKDGKILEFEAPKLEINKDLVVPFKIHMDRYDLDSTKFKLIDYKSIHITGTCTKCGMRAEANLLFDGEGRSFGLFTNAIEDRYFFQHSAGIKDKEKYYKDLLALDFTD